jgi:multiple sugar transport system substrate-binding protein
MKRSRWLVFLVALILAACEPVATPISIPIPTFTPKPEEPPPAPTVEAKPSVDPSGQKVSFWHVWGTDLPNRTMLDIVADFNTSNEWGITVEAIDRGTYNSLQDAFNTAINSGELPDLVTGYTNAIANWYMDDVVVDLGPYVNDPYFGLSDTDRDVFYAGALEGGLASDGTFFAFPISQSANVIFYNSQWAKELGFATPPKNYEEFKEQACAATAANNADKDPDNDSTGGLVLYTGASNVASFVFANRGNMLNAEGTGYDFTDQSVVDVAYFWKDLWDNKCAYRTKSYPNREFSTRKALFAISSTAGLPYQVAAFEEKEAIKDEWTLIPFPGKGGGQAVDLFGQYVAITKTSPERMMATWIFLKYLTSPEVQARWIEGSAYYPTRRDSLAFLDTYQKANPIWSYGLSFLQYGKSEPAWPSWTTVRRGVEDTFSAILKGKAADIPALLADLNARSAQAIIETQP